jgi:hypothetical protein
MANKDLRKNVLIFAELLEETGFWNAINFIDGILIPLATLKEVSLSKEAYDYANSKDNLPRKDELILALDKIDRIKLDKLELNPFQKTKKPQTC